MLQGRSLIILAFAILFGICAVIVANAYLGGVENQKAEETTGKGMVRIAVANAPLEFGQPVTSEKVRFVDWPSWSVPEGAFTSTEQLMPAGKQHVVLRPMAVNEPILASKLSGEGGRATLAALLRPDMRAYAVRVSDVTSVAGFVLPGDVVDVLITRQPIGEGAQQITDVLLQNVRVIAIDQSASDDKSDPVLGKAATLEVSQVDAQKLALAQQVGALSLALKKPAEEVRPLVETVGTEDLRDGAYVGGYAGPSAGAGSSAPMVHRVRYGFVRPAAKKTTTVEVVRGTASKDYEVGRYVGF
jgi:pilus assembly protein CpaB